MDVHKHSSSLDNTREVDYEFKLAIPLSESDPLFSKKKNLFKNMGFDTEGSVYIKSSSTPDQVKHFLNVLLQRARVRSFNEVELYFAGDVIDKGGYSSPRNELEALHAILDAINKSLSGDMYISNDAVQKLRADVVDRINALGSEYSEETKVIKNCNCVKEKCLLDWSIGSGVKTKLDIVYVEGAGRGAMATQDLAIGDIAIEIPLTMIISDDSVCESDMYPILSKVDGITVETMLLLWSMKEKCNKSSRFKLYFDSLPEKFNTGLSFGVDAVMALDGTLLLEEIMQAKEHLRTQYEELSLDVLCNHPDVFPPKLYTFEQYIWACELWYSNSMKIDFGEGMLRTCLIPIAGFLNHSTFPHITHYGKIDVTTNSLKFPLSRACRAGEQCFLSYGKLWSSHLLTFYGFLPQGDNQYDIIPLNIDAGQDEDCDIGGQTPSEWSSHMVRGTWLSENHEIFHYGLPSPLLDHLRRAQNPDWESNSVTQENLELELNLLRDLTSTFEGMMDALGEDNLEERETMSWDVELAIEFKDLQRKIVSSILTSCSAGCELVEFELSKLTV